MNYGPFIFLGVLLSFAVSWFGVIFGSVLQLGSVQPATVAATGGSYPTARPGAAVQGRDVYRANGCAYCHTQQVRAEAEITRGKLMKYRGGDVTQGWGSRPSVAPDYIHDQPVMLGSIRLGQDLANVGVRQTNEIWHLTHLYDPRAVSPGSLMPSYRFLFEKREIIGERSMDALPVSAQSGVEAGYEIVPKPEASALVAYLLSLRADEPLFEAPSPEKPKQAADVTNAVPSGVTPAIGK